MNKKIKRLLYTGICLLALFSLWTLLVSTIDVRPIGPMNSKVGLATLNGAFAELVGVNMYLYNITDALSIIPLAIILSAASLGLFEWVKRKKLRRVDADILALGVFYVAVIVAFVSFEIAPINYRPVLIDGVLEASYPSSTTMLVGSVMPTAAILIGRRIKNTALKRILYCAIAVFCAFMIIGRILSGVHWLTDIIGGIWLSSGLVVLYCYVCGLFR